MEYKYDRVRYSKELVEKFYIGIRNNGFGLDVKGEFNVYPDGKVTGWYEHEGDNVIVKYEAQNDINAEQFGEIIKTCNSCREIDQTIVDVIYGVDDL